MKIGELRDELDRNGSTDDDEIYLSDPDGWLYDFQVIEAEKANRYIIDPLMDTRLPEETYDE